MIGRPASGDDRVRRRSWSASVGSAILPVPMADVNNTVEGGPPQSVAALEELFGAYDATRDLPENLEIPEYLWHYTTGAGLKGIIESDALWATEIHYLNDVGEFNLVTALMTQELASRVDSSPHKAALAAAQHYFSRTDFASAAGLLICSFTTERDQLSQWRGYTEPGDGYNIGIAGAHIKNIVPIESGHLRPCNYDPAHAVSIMRNAVTTSFERFAVHGSEKQLIDELRTHVVLMAAWCKHESFREEILLRPCQDFHRLGEITVTSDLTMIVAICPNQIGEDLRVAAVGLSSRRGVPVAVSADCVWVDGVYRIAGGDQALHQQAAIGLDADDNQLCAVCMQGNEFMKSPQAFHTVGDACSCETFTGLVEQAEIVVILGPVDAQIDHCCPPCDPLTRRARGVHGVLMDQCSRHDIPPAVGLLTAGRGHGLALVLAAPHPRVVTHQGLGFSMPLGSCSGPISIRKCHQRQSP